MKAQLFIAVLFVFSIAAHAQNKSTQKLTRLERKTLKEGIAEERKSEVLAMLQDTSFILEATRLSAPGYMGGSNGNVDPNLHFVALYKDTLLIQAGLNNSSVIGFGGSTMQAKLRKMKIRENSKGSSTRISGYFTSDLGEFRLDMRIINSGIATASIEQLSNSKEIIFRGDIKPFENSTVFTGGPVF